ncbi:MAG: cation-translocating P-type ATPase [Limnochordaceae bacterium]|nr:cation-translocating P-type ATPase [Limnochordaceae bacterium]
MSPSRADTAVAAAPAGVSGASSNLDPLAEVITFEPGEAGLTEEEARRRLQVEGPNELSLVRPATFWRRLFEVVKEPMFVLLLATASIYFLLGELQEGLIMLVFVGMVILVTFVQEWRTERALAALRELSAPKALVYRDRVWRQIPAQEVVPGDFVEVAEGERVPADLRLQAVADLCVDESLLTGEAEPIWKAQGDLCYAGTTVLQGQGWGTVEFTGQKTQYGQIGELLSTVAEHPTPLQSQIKVLVRQFFLAGIVCCLLVVMLVAWQQGRGSAGWTDAFLAGISLAMAMIPEEFPVVLTVFFALGAARLSRQQALVRRMPAVETLGSVQVLCVDKTGTLTENRMSVRSAIPWEVDECQLATWAVLACEENPYDPMDLAIQRWSAQLGVQAQAVRQERRLAHEYPFRPADRWMGHIWQDKGGGYELAVKGAPETVLPLCGLNAAARQEVEGTVEQLASQGLRVLAVACSEPGEPGLTPPFPQHLSEHRLRLVGLVGLADPPRAGVRQAVAACHEAGVRVVMITGDHAITAMAIGREVGLNSSGPVLTGEELERLSDEELDHFLSREDPGQAVQICARVLPGQKLRLVRAFRRLGQVVAMTGDGVNDAPALKEADIGVAMGQRGTEVARGAAGLVLLDDNFVTIVGAIRQGRRIYDNIRKAVAYIGVAHLPIAGLALLAPMAGLPLFLWPVHIALLELLLDPTCSVVFEASPEEPDLMHQPPRSPRTPLVTGKLAGQVLTLGGALLAATFLVYQHALASGGTPTYARSLGLIALLLGNVGVVFTMSSEREPFWRAWVRAVRWWAAARRARGEGVEPPGLTAAAVPPPAETGVVRTRAALLLGTLAVLALVIYLPPLQRMMGTEPLSAVEWGEATVAATASTFWWELVKAMRR